MMTFLTVPRRCLEASLASVKRPVDSITICAPTDSQGELGRILDGKYLDLLARHCDGIRVVRNCFRERSQHRVVLQQVRQRCGIGQIVYRYEFHIIPVQTRADNITANAAEAINSYFDCHYLLLYEMKGNALIQRISRHGYPLQVLKQRV